MLAKHLHARRLLVLALPLALATPAYAEPDARTVALLPLLGTNLALDELVRVDEALRKEVEARFGNRALPAHVVRERLDKRALQCDRTSEACQVQLGIVAEADLVLVPSLAPSPAPGQWTLTVRAVDVIEAGQAAMASASVSRMPAAADIKRLLGRLLDDPAAQRTLLVVTGPSGAPVVVDGKPRGSLPLPAPFADLAPGAHEVEVHADPIYRETVELRRGERVEIRVGPAPPAPPTTTTAAAPAVTSVTVAAAAGDDAAPDPSPPAKPAVPATAPFPVSPQLLAFTGGGAAAVLGAVALYLGLLPFNAHEAAAAELRALEADVGDDPEQISARLSEIELARAQLDVQRAEWDRWGAATAALGGALTVAGVGAVVAGFVLPAE